MKLPTISGAPMGKRVLVFPDEAETKSAGGIIIPIEAQKNARTGIVCQVGDECEKIKPYQPVLFGEYSGSEMQFEEGRFILMFESDIQYAWPALKEEDMQKNESASAVTEAPKGKRKIKSTVL